MSLYLLDTNAVTDLSKGASSLVALRIAEVGPANVVTNIVVSSEVAFGLEKKGSARLKEHMAKVMAAMVILPLEQPADSHYGKLRDFLRAQGTPIGPNDLFIAAHALALDAVLVTANEKEFSRVPGLKIENWLRETAAT
ncbi:type II toxin-antitoxin system VapC family toxin [Corticibacterium sp. UT-5YL-CI-8]|nr:type II toxin-antitoxin system VapC family toxin [Tianweitania sp. UT-5YL-CI-8]